MSTSDLPADHDARRRLALLHLLVADHAPGALAAGILAQDLPRLHARQLLAQLRRLRAAQSNLLHYAGATEAQAQQAFGAAIAALKAELARRPHLPNKQEAKALRQAAAKRR
ncbi:hypothetical protein [Janthinobacterium psychrotolerans]|uniref:Uncharacterized protein n=1 Tax=Janthinobacterium psychrotolerans TaxID=1747903 RepID=A0A1A7BZ73_9BURK|nr:hypothetical protein [Janthinobacterium psychrotolerans]OBV38807.1 hypothetical protein ASR47_1007123 [Janthinobacterium psychrotolerans]